MTALSPRSLAGETTTYLSRMDAPVLPAALAFGH